MTSLTPVDLIHKTRHRIVAVALAAFLLVIPVVRVLAAEADEEIQMGKTSAAEIEKQSKFVKDEALMKRLETVGGAIAKIAKQKEVPATYGKPTLPKFDFVFKIVDDPEVNAFALPAGYVYVNKGLLDFIQSDDELAGVLAHEISHASHHHLMQLLKAQEKQNTMLALAMLMGVSVGAKGDTLTNIWQALTLIRVAKLSAYSQDAEFDADKTAVAYLAETKYNPVGVLTSMERLARDEMRKPSVDMGIFATHPASNARAKAIISEIESRGLPINRRLVTTYLAVQVKPAKEPKSFAVWIGEVEIMRLAEIKGETAEARAEKMASKLATQLVAGAQMRDVKADGEGLSVAVARTMVISPTPEDAALAGKSIPDLVNATVTAIRQALLNERLNQQY